MTSLCLRLLVVESSSLCWPLIASSSFSISDYSRTDAPWHDFLPLYLSASLSTTYGCFYLPLFCLSTLAFALARIPFYGVTKYLYVRVQSRTTCSLNPRDKTPPRSRQGALIITNHRRHQPSPSPPIAVTISHHSSSLRPVALKRSIVPSPTATSPSSHPNVKLKPHQNRNEESQPRLTNLPSISASNSCSDLTISSFFTPCRVSLYHRHYYLAFTGIS